MERKKRRVIEENKNHITTGIHMAIDIVKWKEDLQICIIIIF